MLLGPKGQFVTENAVSPWKTFACSKEANYSNLAKRRCITPQKPCMQSLKTMLFEPAFNEKYKEFVN